MPRYVAFFDDAAEPMPGSLTVFEPERAPEFTGVLDRHGNRIFRIDEREPIGFRLGEPR